MTRRTLLLAGTATAAGAAAVALPSTRHDLRALLHHDPEPPHPVPSGPTGRLVTGAFASRAMAQQIGWSISFPPGQHASLPVLLVLHGRGDDHRDAFGAHRLGAFQAAAIRAGARPFAMASVDGGDHSYWHRRASGIDPQAMVLTELLPLLTAHGLRTDRFGVSGWSMGGFGALLLAERLGPTRVAVAAVDSPALWTRAGDTAAGAFDGPADFTAYDVIAGCRRLTGIPVRVACGTSDPFLPGVRAFLKAVPTAEHDLSTGAHDVAFWQHAAPGQLAFAARHLPA